MSDSQEKLLFRLQHIIPRNLSSVKDDRLYGPEEITFEMPWGKVAAKVWGPPNGRPVLALHGWLDNAATYDALIPLLPTDLRIVCLDIPGHGYSDHYPREIQYHYVDCLPGIQRLAKHLNWETFSIIGHSLGGGLALLFAQIFPEKVEKLVLLDIVRVETTRPETIGIRLRKSVNTILKEEEAIGAGHEKPCSYETALKRTIRGSGNSLDAEACKILLSRGITEVDGGFIFRRDRRLRSAPLDFAPKEDHLILATKVTAEVLIVKSKDGPYFESPECYAEQIEALRTNSKKLEYVEVEGKHHVHLTHPQRIAPHIFKLFST